MRQMNTFLFRGYRLLCACKNLSTYSRTLDVALRQLPELLAISAGLVDLAQSQVHEVVTGDEHAVECLA